MIIYCSGASKKRGKCFGKDREHSIPELNPRYRIICINVLAADFAFSSFRLLTIRFPPLLTHNGLCNPILLYSAGIVGSANQATQRQIRIIHLIDGHLRKQSIAEVKFVTANLNLRKHFSIIRERDKSNHLIMVTLENDYLIFGLFCIRYFIG